MSSYPLSVTGNVTTSSEYNTYLINATGGPLTLNLQDISSFNGVEIIIKRTDTSSNVVTIDGYLAQNINGSLTIPLDAGSQVNLTSNGNNWFGAVNNRGNVTSTVPLTVDAIVKGNGTNFVKTSGISINSLNDLIIKKAISTTGFSNTSIFGNAPGFGGNEWGNPFSLSTPFTVTAFRFYRTTFMSTNSRVIRLWTSTGVLLASATTSFESTGWNTSGPLNTGPLVLSASPTTYVISSTDSSYGSWMNTPISSDFTGQIIYSSGVVNTTPGAFPTTVIGGTYFGVDLSIDGTYNMTLTTVPLTVNQTTTLRNLSGIVALTSDIPNTSTMVTQTSGNTSGNIITGAGTRVIQDSLVPISSVVRSGGPNYKSDALFVQYDNGIFTTTSSNFNITGKGWGSPGIGSLKINVTGGYYTTFLVVTAIAGVNNAHPGAQYTITKASDSSLTEIHLYGTSGSISPANLNVDIILFGK